MAYTEWLNRYIAAALAAGWDFDTANAVRRDAERLDTISEQECNGTLQRIEDEGQKDHRGRALRVGKVYAVRRQDRPGPIHYYITRDMETPARARVEAAAAAIGARVEFQGDPRGLPFAIITKDGTRLAPPIRPGK